MLRRRRAEGSQLAFLDVMACGLGATILLFLVIKHNVEIAKESPLAELQQLKAELESLQERKQSLQEQVVEAVLRNAEQGAAADETARQAADLQAAEDALKKKIAEQRAANAELRKAVEGIKPPPPSDVIDDPSVGEEEYLLGLRVEGKRIAILVDHSSSMTDEKLLDIVSRKIRSDPEKKAGPKWLRTQRVVRWLLNRVPEGSQVSVIAFSDKARELGPGGWLRGGDRNQMGKLVADLAALVPSGPTDLQAGLAVLKRLQPVVTDLYLVTDGLPTQGKAGFPFGSGCSSQSQTISGKCRLRLFWRSMAESGPGLSTTRANVVLLPLEGDPDAAYEYGVWTSISGGLVLAPAPGWP